MQRKKNAVFLGRWHLAVGSWLLAMGGWLLAIGLLGSAQVGRIPSRFGVDPASLEKATTR